MEDTSLFRKVLFYILVFLTILFIFIIFFPRKSYISNMYSSFSDLDFNHYVDLIYGSSLNYFNEFDDDFVSLSDLISYDTILLDGSNDLVCDIDSSFVRLENNSLSINLFCSSKEVTISKPFLFQGKLICLYLYKKDNSDEYTEWGAFSDWQKDIVLSDEFTNVEVKTVTLVDGTKIVNGSRQVSIPANISNSLSCIEGYSLRDSKCVKDVYLNTIDASITYSCPDGYSRDRNVCYSNGKSIPASKIYFCPIYDGLSLRLNGSKCDVYRVKYTDSFSSSGYYCLDGYSLSGNKCYKTEYYEEEVLNYIDVNYYRYQKREKVSSNTSYIFSRPNDDVLINKGYILEKKIMCEI